MGVRSSLLSEVEKDAVTNSSNRHCGVRGDETDIFLRIVDFDLTEFNSIEEFEFAKFKSSESPDNEN